jgi:hypothetical protein
VRITSLGINILFVRDDVVRICCRKSTRHASASRVTASRDTRAPAGADARRLPEVGRSPILESNASMRRLPTRACPLRPSRCQHAQHQTPQRRTDRLPTLAPRA